MAIDIDERIQAEIAELQDDLRIRANLKESEAKWVNPENIHLTLKFLGEVRDRDVTDLCQIVKEVADSRSSFSVDIAETGTFGRPARVVWVGVGDGEDLVQLQGDLDRRLADAGWPKDRKLFAGHLTLCRVKSARAGKILSRLVTDYGELELGKLFVDSVCVYQSELTNSGPVYTVVSRCSLRN